MTATLWEPPCNPWHRTRTRCIAADVLGIVGLAVALATSNDDGVRVYIDRQPAIDDWRFHYRERHEAIVDLPAGFVPLRVEYFEVDLGAEMRLSWSSTALGMSEEIIS